MFLVLSAWLLAGCGTLQTADSAVDDSLRDTDLPDSVETDNQRSELAGSGSSKVSGAMTSGRAGGKDSHNADLRDALSIAVDLLEIPGTDIRFQMVLLPGGEFSLGSDPDESGRDDDEGPRRRVSVDPFWIGKFEVTYDEWVIFQYTNRDSETTAVPGRILDVDAVARPSPPYEDPSHGLGGPGRPAVGMTQWGALHYAQWLSDKTGKFFRLPTEAEWEYACRAGSTFDFGESDSERREYAWFEANSDDRMHAAGSRKPNAWGLYDMLGNVSEWTLDQYEADYYDSLVAGAASNPWRQPTRLHPRTVRGGAYDDPSSELRCAARIESTLNWKRRDPQIPKSFWWNTDSPFVGFRLVRPVKPPSAEEQELFWLLVLGG